MPQCSQCPKPAIYNVNGHPLCLDCNYKVEMIEYMRMTQLVNGANAALDDMEAITGVRNLHPRQRMPPPPVMPNTHNTFNNIHVENSTVGVVNTGDVKSIDSVVSSAKTGGNLALASALKDFTQAVLDSNELKCDQKNDVVSQLAFLSQQAVSKDKQAPTVMRAVLAGIERAINGSASLVTLWPILNAHLQPFLGF